MDYKKPQSTLVQGGAGIYPLTTADQVILADGSRLEKDGKISADSAANSAKLGGKAPEYYLQPRNLLDNSDFGSPVNQRGQTNYTTAFAYGIDRWLVGEAGNMWIAEDSPTGKNVAYSTSNDIGTSYMWQKIVETLKAGKTYTFAVSFYFNSGHITLTSKATDLGIATIVDSSEPSGIVTLTFTPNVDYTVDDGNTFVRIHTSGTIGLNWAALYEGSYTADTLPPYVPKGYAAELAECRRYFVALSGNLIGIAHPYTTNDVYMTLYMPTKMRRKPTVELTYLRISNNNYITDSDASISSVDNMKTVNTAITFFANTSSTLTPGRLYGVSTTGGVYISADL